MSVNTSLSPNASLHRPQPTNPFPNTCFRFAPGRYIFMAFTSTNIVLLLPLSVFILLFGFQHWRKQRSRVMPSTADIFTYHMIAMELMGTCASILCCCGAFTGHELMSEVGSNVFVITSCVKMYFHILTCVERYLAVVHPISYLSLKKSSGDTIRNISIGFVWFVCAGLITLKFLISPNFNMMLFFCNLSLSLVVISACSFSVLRVLIRPGPGDQRSERVNVDKTKQRAFVTITAILAVLVLRFVGNLVCVALAFSHALSHSVSCGVLVSGVWFCLPSSYVLPLLFLHRAGKLAFTFKPG